MKKIILMLILSFSFINSSALTYGGCEYSTVSRMKSIVSNINLSYDYEIINNEANFSVTLNNLTEDIYIYDDVTGKNYYYSDTNNGEITIYDYKSGSGSYKFYSNNSSCRGISLGTKYYNLPKYNKFFNSALCSDIPNYSLCQKWASIDYSQEEFEKLVSEYKTKSTDSIEKIENIEYEKTLGDIITEWYINYYYYLLGGIIVICSIIIFVSNRKNKFKL